MARLILWLCIAGIPLVLKSQDYRESFSIPVFTCEQPDIARAQREDASNGTVPRFALPVNKAIHSEKDGLWQTLPHGGHQWDLWVHAPGAYALILTSEGLPLLPGSLLEVFDGHGQLAERYHGGIMKEGIPFTIGPVAGDLVHLRFTTLDEPSDFSFNHIFYAFNDQYRPNLAAEEVMSGLGFGTSLACQVNVNCISEPVIQQTKNSTVRILQIFAEGASYCSGALINNTRQDSTPYILSAFHCQYGNTPLFHLWAYFFNYESQDCATPQVEPQAIRVTGSQLRAKWANSDFALLELTQPIPTLLDLHFSGWDRTVNYTPTRSYFLHHPSADIKKVSIDSQQAIIWIAPVNWTNGIVTPGSHHYRVYLNLGASEGGSSGGGFYDFNGRIVGQLHGGNSNCELSSLLFGCFFRSWNGGGTPETRLRDWLDPDNTGVLMTDGLDVEGIKYYAIEGQINTPVGFPVPGVQLNLTGSISMQVTSGPDGRYLFPAVPAGENWQLTAWRDGPYQQGVTISDVILLNKYLLGQEQLPTPFALVAADVNSNGAVTLSDLLEIRRLLLGISQSFPNTPSWRMIRTGSIPFTGTWSINNLSDNLNGLDFIGLKMGDVNHSLQP
jgi:hypothetical protein